MSSIGRFSTYALLAVVIGSGWLSSSSVAGADPSPSATPATVRDLLLSNREAEADAAWKSVAKGSIAGPDKGASLIGTCIELGEVASNRGMLELSRSIYETGLKLARKVGPASAREEVVCLQGLAGLDVLRQRLSQAGAKHTKAIQIAETKLGMSDSVLVRSLTTVAYIEHRDGHSAEAAALLDRAERICREATPIPYTSLVRTLRFRADIAMENNLRDFAKATYDSALALARQHLATPSAQTAMVLAGLSTVALDAGQFSDACDLATEARAIFSDAGWVALVKEADDRIAYTRKRRDGPQYDSKYVQGKYFMIGRKDDVQVWLCAEKGSTLDLLVYITNGSDRSLTIIPEQIGVSGVLAPGDNQLPERLKTYSAAQYEAKVRSDDALRVFFAGVASSMANQPQPQTSGVSGQYYGNSNGTYGWNSYSGSYYGTVTQYPSAKDYADARARTNAQISQLQGQLEASFGEMARNLMRSHTLDPRSFYGGVVHAQKWGNEYKVTIPFGGQEYEFFLAFK